MQTVHNIEWETHTLCKRHGYSLCDAHGGQGNLAAARAAIEGAAPNSSLDFARIINECFANARAYSIATIDRSSRCKDGMELRGTWYVTCSLVFSSGRKHWAP
jgi:hypothetical protein